MTCPSRVSVLFTRRTVPNVATTTSSTPTVSAPSRCDRRRLMASAAAAAPTSATSADRPNTPVTLASCTTGSTRACDDPSSAHGKPPPDRRADPFGRHPGRGAQPHPCGAKPPHGEPRDHRERSGIEREICPHHDADEKRDPGCESAVGRHGADDPVEDPRRRDETSGDARAGTAGADGRDPPTSRVQRRRPAAPAQSRRTRDARTSENWPRAGRPRAGLARN